MVWKDFPHIFPLLKTTCLMSNFKCQGSFTLSLPSGRPFISFSSRLTMAVPSWVNLLAPQEVGRSKWGIHPSKNQHDNGQNNHFKLHLLLLKMVNFSACHVSNHWRVWYFAYGNVHGWILHGWDNGYASMGGNSAASLVLSFSPFLFSFWLPPDEKR